MHGPTVGSNGVAAFYERDTPVVHLVVVRSKPVPLASGKGTTRMVFRTIALRNGSNGS